jgi:hypothetical protein
MVLMGLLVAFALTGVRYYQRLFRGVIKDGNEQSEINMLFVALSNDIQLSNKVLYQDYLICEKGTNQVVYKFLKDKIARVSYLSSDTFYVNYERPSIIYSEDVAGLVQQISLNCKVKELILPVNVVKKYPIALKFETGME